MPKPVEIINPAAALAVAIHQLQLAITYLTRSLSATNRITGAEVATLSNFLQRADRLTSKVLDGIDLKDIVRISNAGFDPAPEVAALIEKANAGDPEKVGDHVDR